MALQRVEFRMAGPKVVKLEAWRAGDWYVTSTSLQPDL